MRGMRVGYRHQGPRSGNYQCFLISMYAGFQKAPLMLQGGTVVNADGQRHLDVHIKDGLINSLAASIQVRSSD